MTLSIFDAARDEPERLALVTGDAELTFGDLAERVAARLSTLDELGALDASGARPVAVLGTPALETVETLLALLAAGTPTLLLHARAPELERKALIERAGAFAELLGTDARAVSTQPARASGLCSFDPERIAVIVPTSGTTGAPRLARLSHRALLAAARASARHLGVEDDRWLLPLPLAHVGGLSIVTRSLVARRAAVLFEPRGSLLAQLPELIARMEQADVTLVSLVPAVLERLLAPELAFQPPASLRAVLLGGSGCSRDLAERAHARRIPLLPTYGMTETCAQVTTRRYADRWAPPPAELPLVPSGISLPGVELRIRDSLIEVRGPTSFSGYAGEPPPFEPDGWFRTGDRGRITPEGELVVTGRASELIVSGGENVDPLEVEAALLTLPDVRGACVIGVPDATFGEIVTALLVLEHGSITVKEIASALASRLASFKLPRKVLVIRELPLGPTGKLDRNRARTLYASELEK